LLARPLALCDVELTAIAATLTGARNPDSPLRQGTDPIGTVRELVIATNLLRQNADRLDRLLVAGFALSPEVSSAPLSPVELLNQLTEVQREESRLALTVQRLQQVVPNHRSE
jgi:hypothetical protein